MRLRHRIAASALLLVVPAAAATANARPRAATAVATPRAVGALFSLTARGRLGTHFCTATVVHSARGNVVLTAAHCLVGRTLDSLAFVPGYRRGSAPLGVWKVDRAFVDGVWTRSASVDDDFAFLVVRNIGIRRSLEALTGAERLRTAGAAGKRATVVGYPAASDNAIACTNSLVAFTASQLEFDCDGYTNGTSGSALVVDPDSKSGLGTVVGVIGGYEQGGYTPSVSYAALFGERTVATYRAAADA